MFTAPAVSQRLKSWIMTAKPHPGSEPDTRWKERSSTGNPSRRRHPESERPRCRPKCRRAAQQPTQQHPANGTRVPTESSDTREQGIPAAPHRSGAQWEPTAPGQAASEMCIRDRGNTLLCIQAGQNCLIARQLTIGFRCRGCCPHQRMEPVYR